ncbi:MAG TPA: BRO family protein [Beutenbergiaceae bacterium]|nr:BRO family protein [Beutenbergiaceae bacterium]
MSGMTEIAEAVFGSSPIRTGYSKDKKAAFAVAADIKGVMNYTSTLNAFLRGLEKQQEIAGQGKGNSIVAPLYTGLETVQTAGGPQKMKVIYKRGVFQLLMLSRKPEATQYRDRIFDVLERIERDGYYFKSGITQEQLEAAKARIEELHSDLEMYKLSDEGASTREKKAYNRGVMWGQANPNLRLSSVYGFDEWEQDFS